MAANADHAPRFSIVIPTYNRAKLIRRAVESVLAQTVRDLELIVVDDGSTDATRSVIDEIEDPRLRYVAVANAGAAAARNTGARLARGTYLTFLDSDDEAHTDWLEEIGAAFDSTGADIVCCGCRHDWSEVGQPERNRTKLPHDLGELYDNQVGLFTNGGVFAMRTPIFHEVGGYASELRAGQHTELSMRLIPLARNRGWKIYSLMKPLVRIVIHPGERIRTNPAALLAGTTYILRVHRDLLARSPKRAARSCGIAGVAAVRLGRYAEGRKHFMEAVRWHPVSFTNWSRLLMSLNPWVARRIWSA